MAANEHRKNKVGTSLHTLGYFPSLRNKSRLLRSPYYINVALRQMLINGKRFLFPLLCICLQKYNMTGSSLLLPSPVILQQTSTFIKKILQNKKNGKKWLLIGF
jgi:hypothetical protein